MEKILQIFSQNVCYLVILFLKDGLKLTFETASMIWTNGENACYMLLSVNPKKRMAFEFVSRGIMCKKD